MHRKTYLNKFRVCARTRPLELQYLGSEFYEKEHSKPLLINKFNNE